MKINTNTLRFRLYVWYFGSLVVLSLYFYIIVHLLMLPHSTHIFIMLIALMALFGFAVVYTITSSIKSLAQQISTISSQNLDKRVTTIEGGEELKVLAHSFNHVLDNLDIAFKREQQFISDLAHELKTPLATLQTSLEVALNKARTLEEYRGVLKEALQDTSRLTGTLQNVFDLAWTETKHEQKKMEKIHVSALLEEIVDIASILASSKKITIENSIDKNIYILGRKDKLAHAIINIVENAVHYTKQGIITITLTTRHNSAIITIKDTGLGIAKEDIPHIFDRFYRGTQTKNIVGSGLGLAIAHSIILMHHGKIEAKSIVHSGSEFVITIPL